jgi:hypothetical protein
MTGRSIVRVCRWVALAAVAPALWACNARSLEKPVLKPEATYEKTFQSAINRNVDLLFLIDDSSSMTASQDNLRNNFPTFMQKLKEDPGLPNIHVAVVSSDMGADGSCDDATNKRGIFQYTAKTPDDPTVPPCTTNLDPGATFISDTGGVRNYTGNIEDTFSCIARLGQTGCGFEHQFAAILRALGADGAPAPAENANFLRPEAYLVVVLITNEDDCSASPGVPLFDTSANQDLASRLGPIKNFRCNEFGHLCDGMPPNRKAPGNDMSQTVSYANCTSNDRDGYLLSALDTANRLKLLKPEHPDQVIVAAITGPATPYTVHWTKPTAPDTSCGAASCPWPEISTSCGSKETPGLIGFADPSVRINEFVDHFGDNGLKMTICTDNFAPALDRIGTLINQKLKPPCVAGTVAKKRGTQEDDCTVVSHLSNDQGGVVDKVVPSCASGAAAPCWRLTAGGACGGSTVDVSPDPAVPTSTSQNATVNCALCIPGTPDRERGCP